MDEYQVTCIVKPDDSSPHDDITHIGNLEDQWCMTVRGAIYQIEKKVSKFYVLDHSTKTRCYLEIVRELGKRPYLKAHVGARWTDILLAQGCCNENCRLIS
jgi:hypothetical protein